MKRIYLDNCATSWPKAPGMAAEIASYIEEDCVNLNRTSSSLVMKSFDFLYSLRENLAEIYNYPHPECVIFKSSLTEAINWIIKGLLKKEDHVIVTGLEHNAVMRPLVQQNICFSVSGCDEYGFCKAEELSSLIRSNTKALIVNAASNVFGTVQDLNALARQCKKHSLMLIIDSAQASPFVELDMSALGAVAICFAGHKGFLGPQGTGGFIIRKDYASLLEPLISGGTGSQSDSFEIPQMLPDKFSPGTENLVGLKGLSYSVNYVMKNMADLKEKYFFNLSYLYNALSRIEELKIVGPTMQMNRTNAVSVRAGDISLLANLLAEQGIETRVGLHCAPLAHKTMGTFPTGTLRFSTGPFTTKEEIDCAIKAIKSIVLSKTK